MIRTNFNYQEIARRKMRNIFIPAGYKEMNMVINGQGLKVVYHGGDKISVCPRKNREE